MTNWYEWVFSGVGVAVLGFAIQKIFIRKNKGPKIQTLNNSQTVNESPGSINVSGLNDSVITIGDNNQVNHHHHHNEVPQPQSERELVESKTNPNNIYTEVMKLRPGLRPHAISQYHNLTVCWQITFKGYDSMEPPSTVHGRYLNGAMQVILNVDSLPHELIIAEEDTLFWATGKIKAINIYGVIELSEATILKVG